MAVTTKAGVPAIITAGDTVIISVGPDLSYPNTGWTLQFVLSRDGKVLKSWNASVDPNSLGFIVTIAVGDWDKIAPGRATWSYLFTETATSQRETGSAGELLIAPDPTKTLPDSENAKALKAVNVAITKVSSRPNSSVNFNGQSYTSKNADDLFKIRDRLQIIVDNELRSLGVSKRGGAKLILTKFR